MGPRTKCRATLVDGTEYEGPFYGPYYNGAWTLKLDGVGKTVRTLAALPPKKGTTEFRMVIMGYNHQVLEVLPNLESCETL